MELVHEDLIRLVFAVLIGGAIGVEREFRDKTAGFRTIILICVGATLFTIFSFKLGEGTNDPTRIAANIVSGIGFLGAGAILRDGGRVSGLTTACTIWLAAALGMGIAGGEFVLVAVSTATVLLVLWVFPRISRWLDIAGESRFYEVNCILSNEKFQSLQELSRECGLKVSRVKRVKAGDAMVCSFNAFGPSSAHGRLTAELLEDREVREFRY